MMNPEPYASITWPAPRGMKNRSNGSCEGCRSRRNDGAAAGVGRLLGGEVRPRRHAPDQGREEQAGVPHGGNLTRLTRVGLACRSAPQAQRRVQSIRMGTGRGASRSLRATHPGACAMPRMTRRHASLVCVFLSVTGAGRAAAQGPTKAQPRLAATARAASGDAAAALGADSLNNLKFRNLGPSVGGGRVAAVVGIPGQPNVYYVGAGAGGVWKTSDGGNAWTAVFAAQPTASIGAIALAPSNPN